MNTRTVSISLLICLLAGMIVPRGVAGAGRPAAPILYQAPLPGAEMVSRESSIVVRFDHNRSVINVDLATMFVVTGDRSGTHFGSAAFSDDAETIVFKSDIPFEPGEQVHVSLRYRTGADGAADSREFSFRVSANRNPPQPRPLSYFLDTIGAPPRGKTASSPVRTGTGVATYNPPPDFPPISIGVNDSPGEGYVFLTNYLWQWDPFPRSYLMIPNNDGTPFFFRKSPTFALDFKKQNDLVLSYFEYGAYRYLLMDSTYTRIEVCGCDNGYLPDPHDFNLLDNGHALIMCQDVQTVDMSQVVPGGQTDARVVGMIFQELDLDRNAVFEWRTWDHFEITDAIGVDFTGPRIDYVHSNALVLDNDGNWLVSHRHLSEITKINRTTGDIMWRLGGKNNQFLFVNDINDSTGFHYQHDIRAMADGNYLLYDNGNFHSPEYSHAVE